MSLNCGIVGLPNVGKSTIFSALTAHAVPNENYPFCTVEPNHGVVPVPESRLPRLSEVLKIPKTIPAVVEFVDIAGLVEGASKGEGLGNQFLGYIREVGIIVHVVRCFEDPDITHVSGEVDPTRDIDVVNLELALADLEIVERKMEKNEHLIRSDNKEIAKQAAATDPVLDRLAGALSEGKPVRSIGLSEAEQALIADLQLTTLKRQLLLCNIDEATIGGENAFVRAVRSKAEEDGADCLALCGQLESEIALLESEEERGDFLESAGLEESGLVRLVRSAYEFLGLRTFFTENGKEVRAWTFQVGQTASSAAGIIHSDFEQGFIKAEVYSCEDLFELGAVSQVKDAGRLRIEGREYPVADGDVILFRFNL